MKNFFNSAGRVAFTLILVFVAAVVIWNLWIYYEASPRTRDGRVRADVVGVAADVSGPILEVRVHDNQAVRRGDILFKLDKTRHELAVRQAMATAENAEAALTQAQREADRYKKLNDVASVQQLEQANTAVLQARAAMDQAKASLDIARLDLKRTTILAPVNGIVTNLTLRPGDYINAGAPVLALVDSDSFYVVGYFEETKLRNIHVGRPASIRLMGDDLILHGHVEGTSAAIEDSSRTVGANLLPNVNPSFTWVRLAQRVPVRIALDDPPAGLVAGRTATVEIMPQTGDESSTDTVGGWF